MEQPLKSLNSETSSEQNTWLLLINGDVWHRYSNESSPDIVKLRHPRSGMGTSFMFSSDNSMIYELFLFSEKKSWFVNDTIKKNCPFYFVTPIDPSFLVLQYLIKSKKEGKTVPIEDLLIDDMFPNTKRLLESSALKNIHFLADRKGSETLNAYSFNEEKTLNWLCKKVEKVTEVLKKKQIYLSEGASSKNFIKSRNDNSHSEDNQVALKCAYEIISEYIPDDLSKKLYCSLNLSCNKEENSKKRKTIDLIGQNNKKFKEGNKKN